MKNHLRIWRKNIRRNSRIWKDDQDFLAMAGEILIRSIRQLGARFFANKGGHIMGHVLVDNKNELGM